MINVGIEIGGTFTDLVVVDDGRVVVAVKVPSTPRQPAQGALAALDACKVDPETIDVLVHGSTVATNAVLERKGAAVVCLFTEGFRDLLEIQREERKNPYDLQYQKSRPLVARNRIVAVPERMDVHGEVVRPLDETVAAERLRNVVNGEIESFAVCLLHAYRHGQHEEHILELLERQFPGLHISLSSRVVPEFREYERASTTVLNAYVAPIMDRYISQMQQGLLARDVTASFRIVQSNGGILPAEQIADQAARVLLSGPAAGVIGASHMARASGKEDLITFDMGGTSTDVCVVTKGEPYLTTDSQIDGLPVRVPMIDIATVGAGGGSIAALDAGGLLRVGPESAGADPGPACYGRGGRQATVTDANLILGLIRPEVFFGGRMVLDRNAAVLSFAPIAEGLGVSAEEAAESVIKVANATMAQAVRLVSVERGHDPRDYTLVAFGGAGGLHAASVAEELDATSVLVPINAGVLSAVGLLAAKFKRDYVKTTISRLDALTYEDLQDRYATLECQASAELDTYRIPAEGRRFDFVLDMRYLGQAYELPIPVDLESLETAGTCTLKEAFNNAHAIRYGHHSHDPIEIVNYRLTAMVAQRPLRIPLARTDCRPPEPDAMSIYLAGRRRDCAYFRRDALPAGFTFPGPAVIEEETATSFVPPGWSMRIDEVGNLNMLWEAGP